MEDSLEKMGTRTDVAGSLQARLYIPWIMQNNYLDSAHK